MKSVLLLTSLLLPCMPKLACAQDQPPIPAEVVDFWSALIGDWNVEGFIGSRSVTGSASFEWAEGKFCYSGKQAWDISDSGRTLHLAQIVGWDPARKEIVEQGFSTGNGSATVRYQAPAVGAKVLHGLIDGVSGPDNQWSGKVTMEHKGTDEFQLTSTIDGDVVHSLKYIRKK